MNIRNLGKRIFVLLNHTKKKNITDINNIDISDSKITYYRKNQTIEILINKDKELNKDFEFKIIITKQDCYIESWLKKVQKADI